MTAPECIRCKNQNHAACDGGAWDDAMKPTVCECFIQFHLSTSSEDEEAQRFWAKVDRGIGCWTWTASKNLAGYGQFRTGDRRTVRSHRWSYAQAYGAIPEGLVLDHLCRNRACVRPDHLEPVTQKVNLQRGERANKTSCRKGHPLSGENLYMTPSGARNCRTCKKEARRRFSERTYADEQADRMADRYEASLERGASNA